MEAGNLSEARAALPQLQKAIDKAAARRVIHPNRAARLKARLTRLVRPS